MGGKSVLTTERRQSWLQRQCNEFFSLGSTQDYAMQKNWAKRIHALHLSHALVRASKDVGIPNTYNAPYKYQTKTINLVL